ncbi:TIR domain-containing protein [Ralstonia wenshanensis]|uniref:TIR domain-containing protein n=1 Tax=Ralstonia wenshanensis TaxID=2842456 RepID=A0AAD2AVW7_9RALS|nr:TIR domain-containing protein [Ralstonia wenshanensis]CAJ0690472.1 hypothetical protein LMG18091_01283 [Ralstonia wenshanensis]
MNIFLSWSKEPAKSIAQELRIVLPAILSGAKAWMSSRDIPRGTRWGESLAGQLEQTNVGIIIVTPTNKLEPWLYFEAGALSKSSATGQVHPLVIGMRPDELEIPLAQFQATAFNQADILALVQSLNKTMGSPSDPEEVRERFDRLWPALEARIAQACREHLSKADSPGPATPDHSNGLHLTRHHEEIIRTMVVGGDRNWSPDEIAHAVGIHVQRMIIYLDELTSHDYVDTILIIGKGTLYSLGRQGRRLAMDRGWI